MADFLTSIDILDTGFLTVTSRTNQLSTSERVNSGNSLRLKGVTLNIDDSASVDKSSTPGYIPTTLNSVVQSVRGHEKRSLITRNPTQISIGLLLNANNDDTSNSWGVDDMALLTHLRKLPHTAGFKAIYYPVDNTATDTGANTTHKRDNQVIYQIGEADTTEDQGNIASGTHMTLWTGATSTATGKDLTDVNYVPVRFESCSIRQVANNKIQVTLQGVITG